MHTTDGDPSASGGAHGTTERFEEILDLIGGGASGGKMFGHRTMAVAGKAFCIHFHTALVFKLPEEPRTDALALEGCALFDPSGKGRPMREWVQVPVASGD